MIRPIEGAVYCQTCIGETFGRATPKNFALRYPASGRGKGTCRGCGKTVRLKKAGKIIKKEV